MIEKCILCGREVELKKISGKVEYFVSCMACGKYIYDHFFKNSYLAMSQEEKAMLTAYSREKAEIQDDTLMLADPNIFVDVIKKYRNKSLSEKLENLILYLKRKSKQFGDYVSWDSNIDYPITFSPNAEEASEIVELAFKEGFREKGARGVGLRLTMKGWNKGEEIQKKIKMIMFEDSNNFLYELFELSQGAIDEFCDTSEIGMRLKYDNKYIWKIIRYLEQKKMITFRTDDGSVVSITANGIDEAKKLLDGRTGIKSIGTITIPQLVKSELVNDGINSDSLWDLIHPKIGEVAKSRFESMHFSDAVEAALKEVNKRVKTIVKQKIGEEYDGADLMNRAFSLNNPLIKLDDLSTETGRNIQKGYMLIFSGTMTGIRNPKAHENISIDKKRATHLIFLSSLLMYKIFETSVESRSCHEEVLEAAKSIVRTKGINKFSPSDIVSYMKRENSLYNDNTIRVHVTSRCCVTAPQRHGKRYEYFERIKRGEYKILDALM